MTDTKEKKLPIICIGEALIDMICTDKGQPLSKGVNFLKKAGGAPTNVAAAIAALGSTVQLLAQVGQDPFGDHLVNTLQDFGVDTSLVTRDKEHFTTLAFVSLMESGERDFYFNRGADAMLHPDAVKRLSLHPGQLIHFGSATAFLPGLLQESYFALLDRAVQENCFISFDPNYRSLLFGHQQKLFREQSVKIIEKAHFCKVSDEEAMLLTQTESLEAAIPILKKWSHTVWNITLGGKGTLLIKNGEEIMVESIKVEVTDTTGAGDAFVGAMLHQLSQWSKVKLGATDNSGWKNMVANANKAGARTCMYMGAMEAFKHLSKKIFD
jgi:fructokinase